MKKASTALLGTIAAAMASEPGYHLVSAADAKELIDAGFAEQNPAITEGDKIATRLTETGMAEAGGNAGGDEGDEGDETSSAFTIEDNVPLPSARGGKGGSVYPFDKLAVNQSFFVEATTKRPNPAKSLASTVSSASKRYAGQTPARKFTVRSVEENGKKGARVWRTQ